MARILYTLNNREIVDGSDPNYFIIEDDERIKLASTHQVTLAAANGNPMTGTLSVGYRAQGIAASATEYVSDGYGSNLVVDMANGPQTVVFDAAINTVAVIVVTEIIGDDLIVSFSGW